MRTLTKEHQSNITPTVALRLLRNGNQRFIMNQRFNRDFSREIHETKEGQFPFACVLSCIDSRVPPSLVFDQGLGDMFSIRVAGNVLNDDVLGSMEFACKIAGSKIIVVLGHTGCGAIKGACDHVRLGHLSGLLDKIRPAIDRTLSPPSHNGTRPAYFDAVAANNVHHVMDQIAAKSPILHEMAENGEIAIVGGMYDIETGRVEFFEHPDLCPLELNLPNEFFQIQTV
jgi:carbonic anhydrase